MGEEDGGALGRKPPGPTPSGTDRALWNIDGSQLDITDPLGWLLADTKGARPPPELGCEFVETGPYCLEITAPARSFGVRVPT